MAKAVKKVLKLEIIVNTDFLLTFAPAARPAPAESPRSGRKQG